MAPSSRTDQAPASPEPADQSADPDPGEVPAGEFAADAPRDLADAQPPHDPEAEAEPGPGPEPEPESGPRAAAEPEAGATEPEPEDVADEPTEPMPDAADPDSSETDTAAEPPAATQPEPEAQPEPATQTEPEAQPEPATQTEPATPPEAEAEPEPAPGPEPGPESADAEPADVEISDAEISDADEELAALESGLVGSLRRVRAELAALRFPLALPGAEAATDAARILTAQLDDYLLPRLARLDAPLLVVVGGSTGAGKSTLVNSLVRAPVSQAGVLRPTTRAPVLVGAPADTRWFIGPTEPGAPKSTARSEGHDKQHPTEPYLLPGLARTTGLHAEPGALRVISATGLPGGLALLDAPDLDSVVTENRTLAEKLLGAADLLLFVTTAARYADALPWTALRTARDRGTRLAVVLNRVPAGAAEEIGAHLGELLAAEGLSEAKLFVLPEVALDGQGLLAEQLIAPLGDWLAQLAEDAPTRVRVVADTLGGALAALRWGVEDLAEAVERQHAAAMALRAAVDSGYRAALSTVEASLADGRLLRGEVLVRWREFADGGELRDALKARGHGLGRRVRAAVSGKAPPGGKLLAALSAALVTLIIEAAAVAGDRVRAGWATQPAGGPLLADPGSRIEPADTRTDRARALVREWESAVRQLSSEGTAPEATALLVVLGVLGGDITATGRRALRTLIETSRTDLLHRIGDLFDADAARFTALLTDAEATAGTADRLREALAMGRPE